MTRAHLLSGALIASLLSAALLGQTATRSTGRDLPAAPRAMSGIASSARHCVSGDAANVHGIGWVDAGTSYTITFESDITLVAGVSRLDLAGTGATSAFGTPDLRFTASTAGSMVLYVGGRGQAGCYRYKVEIQQGAPSLAPVSEPRIPPGVALVKPAKHVIGTMAISGAASSARHCVTGRAAKIHGIGRIEQGDDVRITFDSDFDPIAGVSVVNFNPDRGTYLIDDDGGGNLEPLLHFTASQAGTLALHVASYRGRAGCYQYQVQIQGGAAPAPSPPDLTIDTVASSLAQEVGSSLAAALRAGAGMASLDAGPPHTFGASLLRALLPTTAYAQSGFVANCRSGGNVRIQSGVSTSGGGRVVLTNSQAVWSGCGYPLNNSIVTFSGTLNATGTWTASAPSNPVALQGSLSVNEIGTVPIDCSSLDTQHGCHGHVGGVVVGPPDTLPSPNPNTCAATVSPSSVSAGSGGGTFSATVRTGPTCPWTAASTAGFIRVASGANGRGDGTVTFSVVANTGPARTGSLSIAGRTVTVRQAEGTSPLDLSGTWTEGTGTHTMILSQNGNTLSGRAIGTTMAGVIQTSSVTGLVSGGSVSLTETDTVLVSEGGVSVVCQIVIRFTLTASSSSRMAGSYTSNGTCTISGLPPGVPAPPVPPVSQSGTVAFTKR